MKSFLTGSRVYGTPRLDSDVDLVVLVSLDDHSKLWQNRDTSLDHDASGVTIRYGDLNIIALIDDEEGRKQFDIWNTVTEELKLKAPVTKEQAIVAFDKAGRTFTNL